MSQQKQIDQLTQQNILLNKRMQTLHEIIGHAVVAALSCNPLDALKWEWSERLQQWDLRCNSGQSHATVWPNGTWHTWDETGVGGENGTTDDRFRPFHDLHHEAKRHAWEACERQGFITKQPELEDPDDDDDFDKEEGEPPFKSGDWVYYGHNKYEVAHFLGGRVGIYDEPPSSHIDWVNIKSVTLTTKD